MNLFPTELTSRGQIFRLVTSQVEKGPGSIRRVLDAVNKIDKAREAGGGTIETLTATTMI